MPLKRALIITVGTGTRHDVDIVRPLTKTVRDSRPDYTVFVATQDSREHGKRIAAILGLDSSAYSIEIVEQFDDVESVFIEMSKIIRQVVSRGYSPEDIQVDFTSGTKAMSAGAVLAAIYQNCASLKYITGERERGVVKDGTERFVSLCPHAVFAVYEIKTAIELVKKLRFQPAIELLDNINPKLLAPEDIELLASVKAVAQAYDFWDRFEHIKFTGSIKKVKWRFPELQIFQVGDPVRETVHRIGETLKAEKAVINEDVLLDLFNNAERRAMEGRYDDAVARLYRLTEMLAQYVLNSRYQIDTGNVDIKKTPTEMHKRLEAHRDTSDGNKVKIGLRVSYELLEAWGEKIGKKYGENNRIKHLLNERNNSLLAHGNKPVTHGLYLKLKQEVVDLVKVEIDDLEARARNLNFPWIR